MISAVMPTYARVDVAFERGEGCYLFTADGRRFLDFAAGVAVTSLGHCHPRLVAALKAQAETLWHTSNLFRISGQERVAEKLVANSFADSVFFANSGAEAVECAIKMARKYHDENGAPERFKIIACEGGFHGRTLATISAVGQEKMLKGFEPAVEGFTQVAFGNLNEMRAAIDGETAAIIVEPVQGEGGARTPGAGYLKGLRAIADEFGVLLILDEVQTGMSRTGHLFAHQAADMAPDIMAIAKGLGGGFPVGACLANERAASALTAGSHGSTFGGNPLAMAVAEAVLEVMLEPGFMTRVQDAAKYLRGRLEALARAHPTLIGEVRGDGLLQGLKVAGDAAPLRTALFDEGLLVVPAADNVLRLLPPLIVGRAQIDEAAAMIGAACVKLGS